jgi:hypothetical protein
MKKVLAVAALVAGLSGTGFAAEMTGYVSDHSCATSGAKAAKAMDWIKTDAFEACVKKCAKEGSPVVFVTEDNKILTFADASKAKAAAHMGHRVKVTGTTANGVITLESIAPIAMAKK